MNRRDLGTNHNQSQPSFPNRRRHRLTGLEEKGRSRYRRPAIGQCNSVGTDCPRTSGSLQVKDQPVHFTCIPLFLIGLIYTLVTVNRGSWPSLPFPCVALVHSGLVFPLFTFIVAPYSHCQESSSPRRVQSRNFHVIHRWIIRQLAKPYTVPIHRLCLPTDD